MAENGGGPEETSGDSGGDGEGQEPKEEALSRDSKRVLKPISVVLGSPGSLGSCLPPTLSQINEFNCCQRAGIQRSSQLGGH